MDSLRRSHLENFLSKCENALSQFKKKRRDTFVRYGDTQYDEHISRLLSLTNKVADELRDIDATEDNQFIDTLLNEYSNLNETISDVHDTLVQSLQVEFENIDKEIWYNQHFDNWVQLPERQECQSFPVGQRLQYSQCRHKMFDHLEMDWKRRTFPTLHNRLEFFTKS